MAILTMVDSLRPIMSPPAGATVAAGYLDGHGETRRWTADDWNTAATVYDGLVPIYVAFTDFATPENDAESAVAQWKALGFPVEGVAFVLDIEAKVAQRALDFGYPEAWCRRVRELGGVPVDYSSQSTMPLVDQDGSADWVAHYNGVATLDGHAGHQYANPGPWDLSVIDPARFPPHWTRGAPAGVHEQEPDPTRSRLAQKSVALVADPLGRGYWQVKGDGGVFTQPGGGPLPFFGSMGGEVLQSPVRAAGALRDGSGYVLAAEDGGVFTFGAAPFCGSMSGHQLNAPVVSIALTPSGRGYWLLAADGGVFAFGDAPFFGRPDSVAQAVAILADPQGRGYWVVAADGGVFTFGAGLPFLGSMGGHPINAPVVSAAATGDGGGYVLAASDGGVFAFGSAPFLGSGAGAKATMVAAIATTHTSGGYWLQNDDGHITPFGDATFMGSAAP